MSSFKYEKYSSIDRFLTLKTDILKNDQIILDFEIKPPQALIDRDLLQQYFNVKNKQLLKDSNPLFRLIKETINQLSRTQNGKIIHTIINDLIKHYEEWIKTFIDKVESRENYELFVNKVSLVGEDLQFREINLKTAYRIASYDTSIHRFVRRNISGVSIGGIYQDYYFKIDPNISELLKPAKENAVFQFYKLLFNSSGGIDGTNNQQTLISKTELLLFPNLPTLSSESKAYFNVSSEINLKLNEIYHRLKKVINQSLNKEISKIQKLKSQGIKNLQDLYEKSDTYKQISNFIMRKDVSQEFYIVIKDLIDRDINTQIDELQFTDESDFGPSLEESKEYREFINFNNGNSIKLSEQLKKEINESLTPDFIKIQANQLQKGETLESLLLDIYGKPPTNIISHQEYKRNCNKRTEESIDIYSFSCHIIASLLLNTTDCKSDNLIVDKDSKFIIGIDNDHCLEMEEFEKTNSKTILKFKNVLFTLTPLMLKPIDRNCIDQIKNINPDLFILEWLFSIYKKDVNYSKQIKMAIELDSHNISQDSNEKMLNNIKNNLGIPFKLPLAFILKMIYKLKSIKKEITINSSITHSQLFKIIHPLSSLYYDGISDKTPLEQMNTLFNKPDIEKILAGTSNNQFYQNILNQDNQVKDMISIKEIIISFIKDLKPSFFLLENQDSQDKNQFIQTIKLLIEISKEFGDNTLGLDESWVSKINESLLLIINHTDQKNIKDLVVNYLYLINQNKIPPSLIESSIHYLISNVNQESKLNGLIDILVKYGSNIDYVVADSTPLGIALSKNMIQLFIELVNLGAGKTSSDQVIKNNYLELDIATKIQLKDSITKLIEMKPKMGFEIALNHLFPTTDIDDKEQVMYLTDNQKRIVSREFWDKLFDKDGLPRKTNKHGARSVPFIDDGIHRIYIKFNPQLPGIDIAVTLLGEMLFGFTSPYSELAIINGYPVSLIQEIKGKALYDVLIEEPKVLDELDPVNISKLLLLEILVNNGDGNLGNVIINSNKIYSIDNEQCFMPPVATLIKNGLFLSKTPSLQVETSLFLFKQMNDIVPKEVVKCIISRDLIQLLESWLKELDKIHERWLEFFSKEYKNSKQIHNKFESNKSIDIDKMIRDKVTIIGISFADGQIKKFFSKLLGLDTILRKSSVTHFGVLDLLEPQLSHKYHRIIDKYHNTRRMVSRSNSNRSRFLELYEEVKKSNLYLLRDPQQPIKFTQSNYTSTQVIQSLDIPNAEKIQESLWKGQYSPKSALLELELVKNQYTDILRIFKDLYQVDSLNNSKNRTIFQSFKRFTDLDSVDESIIEKVLKAADFSHLSITQENELIKSISKRELKYITFRNSNIESTVISGLNVSKLVVLNLINCGNLVSISNDGYLARQPLLFPFLIKLKIEKCENFKYVRISASRLKIFTAVNVDLQDFNLDAEELEQMNLLDGTFDSFGFVDITKYKKLIKLDNSSPKGNDQLFSNNSTLPDYGIQFILAHIGPIREIIINKNGEILIKHINIYIYGDDSGSLMRILSGHSTNDKHYKNHCFHPILNSKKIRLYGLNEIIINVDSLIKMNNNSGSGGNIIENYYKRINSIYENMSSAMLVGNQENEYEEFMKSHPSCSSYKFNQNNNNNNIEYDNTHKNNIFDLIINRLENHALTSQMLQYLNNNQ